MQSTRLLQIPISDDEFVFLKSFLEQNDFPTDILVLSNPCKLVLDEEMAINLRECLISNIYIYFDINYELTKEGRIAESLIDAIYDAV